MPRTLSSSEKIYIVVAIQADNGINEQDFFEGVNKLEQIWQQESAKRNFSVYMTICAATSDIYDQFDEYTVASDPSLYVILFHCSLKSNTVCQPNDSMVEKC
ncbi:hypothetical protein [Butyrivibrio fibrisolvens]|uniref:hypothetical protein n=1 Tax=Butyrivibrio fibrisolvens TaxID=831 RepID=UPI000487E6FD|nr:hypothetical protein [Butyrivibrio fibrisolvens]